MNTPLVTLTISDDGTDELNLTIETRGLSMKTARGLIANALSNLDRRMNTHQDDVITAASTPQQP